MTRDTEPIPAALATIGLVKTYPGVVALRDVSFAAMPGEVHALVGENGAGKSTLVKIIAGAVAPDRGSVAVGGVTLGTFSPRHAREAGVAVIHQERQIAPDLSVVENVLLGRLPASYGIVRWDQARAAARSILDSLEADIDLDARVRDLPAAQRQVLEIARALHVGAHLILMDEPTRAATRPRSCSGSSGGFARVGSPSSTCRTTSAKCSTSPTGSRSCGTARSSPRSRPGHSTSAGSPS